MYRVNWLRAKARLDRCEEEVQLLHSEMEWTKRFFCHAKERWIRRAKGVSGGKALLVFYALKEAYTWGLLENYAGAGLSAIR